MTDFFPGSSERASSNGFSAITPSDTVNFAYLPSGIYVGGAGNIAAVRDDNTVVNFLAVPAGTTLPIRCKRINAAATSATGLVALF